MRTVLIGSAAGIVLLAAAGIVLLAAAGIVSCVFLGISEIAQPALAIFPKVSTKSGAGACTACSGTTGKPFALAPPGLTNPLSSPFASSAVN